MHVKDARITGHGRVPRHLARHRIDAESSTHRESQPVVSELNWCGEAERPLVEKARIGRVGVQGMDRLAYVVDDHVARPRQQRSDLLTVAGVMSSGEV
jgi:hypothetical protein